VRWRGFRRLRLENGAAFVCLLLVALGFARSAQRETTWRNSARFWRTAASDAPRSKRVQAARRQAVLDLTKEFEPAIASAANPAAVRDTLAYLLLVMNQDSAAAVQLRTSLDLDSTQDEARVELISALLAMGSYSEAAHWANYQSQITASGRRSTTFRLLRQLADSADRAGAPPGSVHVNTTYRRR
jgi:thioredoxin-like negative regulator of GroEL